MVHILKVFKPEASAGSVDKGNPFGLHNMIPCKHDSPALIPKQAALLGDDVWPILFTLLIPSVEGSSADYSLEERQHGGV